MNGAMVCPRQGLESCWEHREGGVTNKSVQSWWTDGGGSTLTGTPSGSVQSSDTVHKWEAGAGESQALSNPGGTPGLLAECEEEKREAQAFVPVVAVAEAAAAPTVSPRPPAMGCRAPAAAGPADGHVANPRRRRYRHLQEDDVIISGMLQRSVYGFFWRWRWVVLENEVLCVYSDEAHRLQAPGCPIERYDVSRLDVQRGDAYSEHNAANEFSCFDVHSGRALAAFRSGDLSCWEEVASAHLWTDALFVAASRRRGVRH